jgi:Ca2+-binding EF-hand superfamily protein
MIDEVDADGSGTIDFHEFLQIMLQNDRADDGSCCYYGNSDLVQKFMMFDKDGDRYTGADELREIVVRVYYSINDEYRAAGDGHRAGRNDS